MIGRYWHSGSLIRLLILGAALAFPPAVWGETVTLRNNVRLEGALGEIDSLNTNPLVTPPAVKAILFVDDDLRRTFFGANQRSTVGEGAATIVPVRIAVPQQVAKTGHEIFSVGMPIREQAFDEHGWRTYTMVGPAGKPIDVIQGITLVTPTYTRLEALQLKNIPGYIWSTRIATSSIPRDQLSKILRRVVGDKNSDGRLLIVKLYIQADRFQEAGAELDGVIKDFPELAELKNERDKLRQTHAKRILDEVKLRREVGQPRLALAMLQEFPSDGVAGEIQFTVRDIIDEFKGFQSQGDKALALLKEHQAALDPKVAADIKPICDEITAELNIHTLDRMADYLRLADDSTTTAEQKVSLAISGWLLGSGAAIDNLSVSKSLVEVRRLVRAYLNSNALGPRKTILAQLGELEGSSPERITRIIAHMKPPYEPGARLADEAIDLSEPGPILGPDKGPAAKPGRKAVPAAPASKTRKVSAPKAPLIEETKCGPEEEKAAAADKSAATTPEKEEKPVAIPGFFEQTCKGPSEHPLIKYYVQLPPEYDPYRRYGVIVTLNGVGRTPQQQIDWWAGDHKDQAPMRYGQATRHGYIVVAPVWQKEYQRKYEYSIREHACVLNSLRDVFRRYAVDSDRVFLTGHSMGGDAAWDIGLAHPDLWAGVMPIVASSDKYVRLYWENAALLPMYFVSGQRDGNKLADNAVDWDRYLTKSQVNLWDIMVVQYLGRGHESYHDDIQNLFTWMNNHKRNFFPTSFVTRSMRPWDNFYWNVELAQFPPNSMVHPVEWTGPKPPRSVPATVEGRKLPAPGNGVNVDSSARKVTVWLSPEFVNFDEKVTVNINNKEMKGPFKPRIEDLLEDVRTRGDRQHPFWLKVQN